MSDQNERSDAEREAARLAREARRRQARGASDAGSTPPPGGGNPRVDPPAPAPPPRRVEPIGRPAEPMVRRAEPMVRRAEPGDSQPPKLPLIRTPEPEPEVPRPAKRVPALRPPRTARRARAPQPPRGERPRRSRWLVGLLAALVVVVVVVAWFLISLFQPFHGSEGKAVEVTIPKNSSTSQIGTLLAHDGVVSSSFFFRLRAQLSGDHFSAGTYALAKGMSYGAALTALKRGPQGPQVTNVTIIPGKSRYQLTQILKSEGETGNYSQSTLKSPLLNPTVYGAPKHTPNLEGFLYPDTYQLRKPISISALVADQLTQFKQEMAKVNLRYAKSKNLTAYDVLTIASLEDAEAALPSDLPKVASVIYNRLALGMDLGLDTTAAYAANNYSGNLSTAQLNSSSPWNTTNHPGLPPTPIDSPDLTAINAAAHPARTNYLYFIVKVCGNGALAFTHSYDAFLALSRQYNASVRAKGANKTEFCGSSSSSGSGNG